MLADLLPGVRELRAPLAAGYLWLLAVYLAFEPLVPRDVEGTLAYAGRGLEQERTTLIKDLRGLEKRVEEREE